MKKIQKYNKALLERMSLGELQELKVENEKAKKELQNIAVDALSTADVIEKTVKAFKLRLNLEKRINDVIKQKMMHA
jgi:hypothetical protein